MHGYRATFIVGTRAQLIKVAPVVRAFERAGLPRALWLTGQHRETMDDLVSEFALETVPEALLPVDEHASVGKLAGFAPRAYTAIVRALRAARAGGVHPVVLAHGDTLSTLLAAAAARRTGCRVAHLESGLSSGRLFDPFPEELVRRLVFRLTDVAYCPDADSAARMRRRRGVAVVDTGCNTIVDSLRTALAHPAPPASPGDPYVVVSLHRFQNLYPRARFVQVVEALLRLARSVRLVAVLHPVTARRLAATGQRARVDACAAIELRPRMPYGAFLRLLAGSRFVLTDGGSNQEELAALQVPTLILRDATERRDGLESTAALVDLASVAEWDAIATRLRAAAEGSRLARLPHPSDAIAADYLMRFSATAGG
jgi:UDP-N-acetylglucosamine 2-epimerase (non-hydrolysing)